MVCSNHPSKILAKIFISPTCVVPASASFPPKGGTLCLCGGLPEGPRCALVCVQGQAG